MLGQIAKAVVKEIVRPQPTRTTQPTQPTHDVGTVSSQLVEQPPIPVIMANEHTPITHKPPDMKCHIHKKYMCIPCECSNDLNGCSPIECHCQDCNYLECADGCSEHRCRGCCYYSSASGWCCPIVMSGQINDWSLSPLLCENTKKHVACLTLLCAYGGDCGKPNREVCTALGFWGVSHKIQKKKSDCDCNCIDCVGICNWGNCCCNDKCDACGFLFFGASDENCYPFWFNKTFSDTCRMNSRLMCFNLYNVKTIHNSVIVNDSTIEKTYCGCTSFLPYYLKMKKTENMRKFTGWMFPIIPLCLTTTSSK